MSEKEITFHDFLNSVMPKWKKVWSTNNGTNHTNFQELMTKKLSFLGKGGFGSVYKIEGTNQVLKFSIDSHHSEQFYWRKELEIGEEVDEYEPSREETDQAFIDDLKNEVNIQNKVYENVKAKDDTPVTGKIHCAFIYSNGKEQLSFIIMDYLSGIPFSQIVSKKYVETDEEKEEGYYKYHIDNKFTDEMLYDIISQLKDILNQNHKINVYHNDLGGDNIFIQIKDNKKPIVKIIDFGQATNKEMAMFGYSRRKRSSLRFDETTYKEIKTIKKAIKNRKNREVEKENKVETDGGRKLNKLNKQKNKKIKRSRAY